MLTPAQQNDIAAIVRPWMRYRQVRDETPSIAATFAAGNRTVFADAYGLADLDTARRATPGTPYRIASHSKLLTSIVMLRLREYGYFSFDDPIADYVPSARDLGDATIRDVLCHRAGITRDSQNDPWNTFTFPSRRSHAQEIRGGVTTLEPLEQFKYSNLGFAIIGELIERSTGRPYIDVMAEELVHPLSLKGTAADLTADIEPLLAVGYGRRWPGTTRAAFPAIDTRAYAAAGGFCMSVTDMAVLMRALITASPRLLTPRAHRELRTPIGDEARPGERYGLGTIHELVDGHWTFGHSGGFPGQLSRALIDPELGVGAAVFANAADAEPGILATGIVHTARQTRNRWEEFRRSARRPTLPLDTYCGTFRNLWGDVMVARLHEQLVLVSLAANQPLASAPRLEPIGRHRFRIVGGDNYAYPGEVVEFHVDRAGALVDVIVGTARYEPFTY